ncbi:unnamed protein product [Nezara viridula]|uniref:Cep192/Spd-2-like domain-containing protein n=1 Tax=Nezara viridula TaxID=85310 RepID=A0A9P0EA07_NEZVI|nr:unnamed protein product [Nezara viridula]
MVGELPLCFKFRQPFLVVFKLSYYLRLREFNFSANQMSSSSKRKVLLEDTVVATPMPQASSTVDKYKMNCYGKETIPGRAPEKNTLEIGELALQRRKAALSELERKLECISPYWSEEQPLKTTKSSSSLFGDSTLGMSHPSFLKMDALMEESGFTNLYNESDLEHEERKRLKNSSYLPSSQVDFSFTVQNSKIEPPDFMPTEDSLFCELQAHISKKDKEIISVKTKREIDQELSSSKHENETKQQNSYAPTIEELSSALKNCLEDTDPRKIMEQLLKAGKNKAPADTEILEPVKRCVVNSGPSSNKKPVTFEECLVWSNTEVGNSRTKILHIIHAQEEKPDKYKFSIQGNSSFKIVIDWPNSSSLSSSASALIDSAGSYELPILFQPNKVGEASGYVIIESQSKQTSKKVRLNAFGGKSKLILHGFTSDLLSNVRYLTLNNSLKVMFTLENVGSSPLFFHFSCGLLQESYDIKPKVGVIKAYALVDVHLSMVFKNSSHIESIISSQETYMNIGSLKLFYGDESARLRLHRLLSRCKGPELKFAKERHPFLVYNDFPSSEVTVSVDDPEESFTDLFYSGIENTEILIKAGRKDLLLSLKDLNQEHYKLLSRSQSLTVEYA